MTPFVIVADLRTGSTLLQTSLDQHPDARCYGELFHPDALPDNQLSGVDRYRMSGHALLKRFFSEKGKKVVGFRAMIFLPMPSTPQWDDAWRSLAGTSGLHVLYLIRRDRLAQYASVRVAQETRVWHPYEGDPILRPENRPSITISPEEISAWTKERDALFALRRKQLQGLPSLTLDYETLTGEWPRAIARVQEFLSLPPLPLPQARQKQEKRPLSEVIANYDEIARSISTPELVETDEKPL